MAVYFDPRNMPTFNLPAVWTVPPLAEDRRDFGRQLEDRARGSLLLSADIVESVLRLLLGLTDVEGVRDEPQDYDPDMQGEWDPSVLTFVFARKIRQIEEEREDDHLFLTYEVEGGGAFRVELTEEKVTIERAFSY